MADGCCLKKETSETNAIKGKAGLELWRYERGGSRRSFHLKFSLLGQYTRTETKLASYPYDEPEIRLALF